MLKYLLLITASISTLVAGPVQARMTGTAHDLGRELCKFCHTPHIETPVAQPLWNRSVDIPTRFEMYASSPMAGETHGQPRGVSLVCLSCHDGVTSPDAVYGYANRRLPPGESYTNLSADPTGMMPRDHPVSMTYVEGRSLLLRPIRNGAVGNLPLFQALSGEKPKHNQIECASCHNPHDPTFGSYLRKDNAKGKLCLTCHIK